MSDIEEIKDEEEEEKKDPNEDPMKMTNALSFGKPVAKQIAESDVKYRQINVDPGAAPGLPNHFPTISKALEAASPYTVIKITSGNYKECIRLNKPNVTLEPKEKWGEVTIFSETDRCAFVDLPESDSMCILKNINLKFQSNSTKEEIKSSSMGESDNSPKNDAKNVELDEAANKEKDEDEFEALLVTQYLDEIEINDKTPCIINIKKGCLHLQECKIDFEGTLPDPEDVMSCIVGQKNSSLLIEDSIILSDSLTEVKTTGIIMVQANEVVIRGSKVYLHKKGGIILDLTQDSKVELSKNDIKGWNLVGVYIRGEDSIPTIEENMIKLCFAPGLIVAEGVIATIYNNKFNHDNTGIMIINNKSKVNNNKIESSHKDGIDIRWMGQGNICNPDIENNDIFESKLNGIIVQGDNANPKISNNIIQNNRKTGIKLTDNAKVDILKDNKIKKNYNQGILIVEGWSAVVTGNTISQNLKANIAYGGHGSQHTKIERNVITGSVAEGIFVIEGHPDTLVVENTVEQNKDGIVFYNSDGVCKNNIINDNQRSGILIGGQTEAKIFDNATTQIIIKDPTQPNAKRKTRKKLKEYLDANKPPEK